MSNLRLQKRLAASIKRCGRKKIWLDPNETADLAAANTRRAVARLLRNGLAIRRPEAIHSRQRARRAAAARLKGRHAGPGKRRGTAEARTPAAGLWRARMRVLRRLLKRYRAAKKIDRHLYSKLYAKAKGNQFKNRRVMMEFVFRKKASMARAKLLADQTEAHRVRARDARRRRLERIALKKAAVARGEGEAVEVAPVAEKAAGKKGKKKGGE